MSIAITYDKLVITRGGLPSCLCCECSCLTDPDFENGRSDFTVGRTYRTAVTLLGDAASLDDPLPSTPGYDEWFLGSRLDIGNTISGQIEFSVCDIATLDWWLNYDKDSTEYGSFKIFLNGEETAVVDESLPYNSPDNENLPMTGTIDLDPRCETLIRIEGTLPESESGSQWMLFKITDAT